MKEKNTNTPVKNRHRLLMLVLALLVMLTVTAVVVTSIVIFNRTTRSYREQIITDVSKLAAEQIDGDLVNGWLNAGADENYMETGRLLDSILENTPYL